MAVFAIVGAGLSGITLARELTAAGHHCQVFEKSRGRGGRLATRRREGWQADHGAQFFTVRDEAFQKVVDDWEANGWVQPWAIEPLVMDRQGLRPAEETPIRYVGLPTMNAMVLGMSEGIDLFLRTRVDRLERVDHQWRLWDDAGEHYGQFDAVFLTAPLAQSLALLPSGSRAEVPLRSATMLPTWSMALAFEDDTDIESDGYFVREGVINWAARDSSKPGREPSPEVWVMHFSPTWTGNHLDAPDSLLQQQCLTLLRKLAPRDLPALVDGFKHRWLYARSGPSQVEIPQWDERLRIGLAGDWILGDRLEDAWMSGMKLAREVVETWH